MPLRGGHVDPEEMIAHRRTIQRSPTSSTRYLAYLSMEGVYEAIGGPAKTIATLASPATTRSATRTRRTANSPSRTSTHPPPSCRPSSRLLVTVGRVAKINLLRSSSLGDRTNLQAILDPFMGAMASGGRGRLDKPEARALGRAREAEVRTGVSPAKEFADREAPTRRWPTGRVPRCRPGRPRRLHALLSPSFVGRFRNRIVNVHPALLPAFPGLDAVGQALEAGVDATGVSVHYVDEGVDTGRPSSSGRSRSRRTAAAGAEGDPRRRARALPGAIRMWPSAGLD